MIPIRLELTNFLSYRRTAVLELSGIHLAGVSGPNGAGKSSLMEAITWALFGQSRVRSDDDLVNRLAGDKEAADVRYTFSLEGVTYRVLRRKQPGKTILLELQMDDGAGGWKPLSEGKVRDTQAEIEALLGMNYDTFTNASFLLQGKADQFTTRTASQRKEILAELLGVTGWERYREKAAAARKEEEGQVQLLEARLAEYALEMEEEEERRLALEEAQAVQQAIVEKREIKELLLNEARLKEAALEEQRGQIAAMKEGQERLQKNVEQAETTLQTRQQRQKKLAKILDQAQSIHEAYAFWQSAEEQVQHFQKLAGRFNEISRAMQPHELQIAQEQSRLEQQQKALREQSKHAEDAREERQALREGIATAETHLKELRAHRQQFKQLQEELNKTRETLLQVSGQRDLWRQELDRLNAQSDAIDLLAKEKTAVQQTKVQALETLADLDDKIAILNEQQQTYSQLQAEKQALLGQQPSLRDDMHKLKERIEKLQSAGTDGLCPLCDQTLSEDHRQEVLAKLTTEGKEYGDRFRANDTRLKSLELELPQVEKTIRQAKPLEADRQAQQKRLAAAEARLEEIARSETAWSDDGQKRLVELAAALADEAEFTALSRRVAELEEGQDSWTALDQELESLQGQIARDRGRLSEIERLLETWESKGQGELTSTTARLAADDFSLDARRALFVLQEQLDALGYDTLEHETAITRREQAADAPQRYQELKEAQAAMTHLLESIEELQERVEQQHAELGEGQTRLDEAKSRLAALEKDSIDFANLQQEVKHLRQDESAASQKVGVARQKLHVIGNLRDLTTTLTQQKREHLLRIQQLSILEKSCGRKGVQALLIEHALPEIEDSANEFLDRLTAGDMTIKFDTQRRLKSRDALAETLDIIISDRAGERPYDNYSGGEQFRINFAIRLALSQLLARRAGTRLQTLVIDEGFGSQDPQGRQRLVEAINAVQDEFACILVITHIDELREAFPTRIDVNKELNGSQITVQ
jgi:DNA repair protein SbcC/Rad50